MDKENTILFREIAKFGLAGGIGGMLGSYSVAKHLPTNTYESIIRIKGSPQGVLNTAFNILNELGQVKENPDTATELPNICALIGSGFFNMNPTLIKITVTSIENEVTQISIYGSAKEGLIKQRAGEKAVKRISEILTKTFSSMD